MSEVLESKERSIPVSRKNFMGYIYPTDTMSISIMAVFAALICVLTMIIAIPIPATQGFINVGDAGVMITALLFGPIIGAIAGGVGSALADIFLGYTIYAPATLIIKGLEGFVVGIIANPKKHYSKLNYRDIIGVLIGGAIMVLGYLIYETLIFGFPAALYEFFLNSIIQYGLSVIIAILFAKTVRKSIIEALPQVFDKIFMVELTDNSL
ncbi:MAG: ECF transporter S component [Promethearchaeota archaeon]|nr:MAG: ECF transporter S component [Candidatus Lokiarchaeota archaeon]